jgi:hypothetical protein
MRPPLATGMFFGPTYLRFRARNSRAGTATLGPIEDLQLKGPSPDRRVLAVVPGLR